jgi:hypothetical protein
MHSILPNHQKETNKFEKKKKKKKVLGKTSFSKPMK